MNRPSPAPSGNRVIDCPKPLRPISPLFGQEEDGMYLLSSLFDSRLCTDGSFTLNKWRLRIFPLNASQKDFFVFDIGVATGKELVPISEK